MTPRHVPIRSMIVDACVLIDFIKAERSVLELVVKHIGPLHVISPVADEINDIEDQTDLIELGLVLIEPEIEDALSAAGKPGPTSFQDRLCLLTAKRHQFTCVTNDKSLRKQCSHEKVPVMWGLELLAELHQAGRIRSDEAEKIAKAIHKSNPKHITGKIASLFIDMIN